MKTSKADFKIFELAIKEWAERLGVTDWDISVEFFPASQSEYSGIAEKWKSVLAWYGVDEYTDRLATICLNKEYEGPKASKKEIEKSAFHELCHLKLYNIEHLATERFGIQEETLDMEIHSLIATLEKVIFDNHQS